MDIYKKPNGKWQVRWREGGPPLRAGRSTARATPSNYMGWLRRRQQLGQAAVPDDVPLCEFIETYWRLHAIPNLSPATRDLYNRVWALHIAPRLGDYGVRELTPKRLIRFRAELERAGVGTATVVKAMTIVQSILSFAVSEELVEYNAAAGVTKPRYERAREPHIFLPAEVEAIRAQLEPARPHPRLRPRVLRAPARGGRLPPRLERRRRARDPLPVDTKRHRTRHTPLLKPLADDLSEWFLASGRPTGTCPVFPAHDGGFWHAGRLAQLAQADWQGEPERPAPGPQEPDPCTPRMRTQRHPAARPAIELRDPPRLRGDSAHADRVARSARASG